MDRMLISDLRTYRDPTIPVNKITAGAGFDQDTLRRTARGMNLAEDRRVESTVDQLQRVRDQRMLLADDQVVGDTRVALQSVWRNNSLVGDNQDRMNDYQDQRAQTTLGMSRDTTRRNNAMERLGRDPASRRMLLAEDSNRTAVKIAEAGRPVAETKFKFGFNQQGDMGNFETGEVPFRAPRNQSETYTPKREPMIDGKPIIPITDETGAVIGYNVYNNKEGYYEAQLKKASGYDAFADSATFPVPGVGTGGAAGSGQPKSAPPGARTANGPNGKVYWDGVAWVPFG